MKAYSEDLQGILVKYYPVTSSFLFHSSLIFCHVILISPIEFVRLLVLRHSDECHTSCVLDFFLD